jgi:hypothetical protein
LQPAPQGITARSIPDDRRAGSRRSAARVAVVFALLLATGCSTLPRNAVPLELAGEAAIPGLPEVRAPAGWPSATMADDLARSFAQESPADFPVGPEGYVRYSHLALSGGGPNGAFGAGFLRGWTRTGKRPVFKIVTGVSTGALIAPFAFLGAAYDDAVHEFYTTTSSRNIFRMLSIVPQLLGGESLADTGPLSALIAKHVDAALLREVAKAHDSGRRLYVGTADLDSQRFVIWNMGLIARSGRPEALELFRKVMLASSSVPVAFPPVYFDVEAGGQRYDEMHVDGSVGTRVFYSGGLFSFSEVLARARSGRHREDIFIIHNGQLLPVAEATPRSLRGIALRVFDSTGKAAVVGDLFRIYAIARRESASFHWVTIPERVELAGNEVFDPEKMRELYDIGLRVGSAGPEWSTVPPGLRNWESP